MPVLEDNITLKTFIMKRETIFCTLLTAHVVFSLLEPLLVFTTLHRSSLAASSSAVSTIDCGLRECLLGW